MNNDKYVFLDIDGTLYDYELGVPKSAREAVKALHDNGHKVVLSTGRTCVLIFDEIMELGFDGMIAGAGTYVKWQKKELFRYELSKKEIIRLTGLFHESGMFTLAEGLENLYYDPDLTDDGAGAAYKIYQRVIPEHVLPIDPETMSCAKISALYVKNSFPDGVIESVEDDYFWTIHNDGFFETIPKSCSKAKGFEKLKAYLDINPDNCYAFGDSFNDYDILKAVKYGVVMGNGDEELKKRIPLHTDSLADDGIYKALKRFGLI